VVEVTDLMFTYVKNVAIRNFSLKNEHIGFNLKLLQAEYQVR
jgi:hypothetical protein